MTRESLPPKLHSGGHAGNIPATTDTVVYQVVATQRFAIKSIVIHNPSGVSIDVTVNVRESGQAVAQENQLVSAEPLASKARLILTGDPLAVLLLGGLVSVKGSGAGLNAWVAGDLYERSS